MWVLNATKKNAYLISQDETAYYMHVTEIKESVSAIS